MENSLNAITTAARNNDPKAKFELGRRHIKGNDEFHGIQRCLYTGIGLIRESASQGYDPAIGWIQKFDQEC